MRIRLDDDRPGTRISSSWIFYFFMFVLLAWLAMIWLSDAIPDNKRDESDMSLIQTQPYSVVPLMDADVEIDMDHIPIPTDPPSPD